MEDRNALDQLMKAVDDLCAASKEYGVDTRSVLAGGALGMLLSSRHGRSLAGKLLKYGAVAGLGALAWQAQRERGRSAATTSTEEVGRPPFSPTATDRAPPDTDTPPPSPPLT